MRPSSGFLLLLVLVGAGLWLHLIDELAWSGPRFDYFIYVAALLVAAPAAVRWPRIPWSLLVLALIELCWGVGSFALDRGGNDIASLLPANVSETQRF